MTLLNETRVARDNLAAEDELIREMNSLESRVLVWMGSAITLHGKVDAADQAQVFALRDQLIAKLTAAVTI